MLKIAIIGPESTGKSELSVALAEHFGGSFVPEFARTYVEGLGRKYGYDDVVFIAKQQIEEQKSAILNKISTPVFFDTELIITKVWFEYCYKRIPDFVTESIQSNYFDLYLLCYPDLPWVPDPVREHGGDERLFFYDWYKREVEATGISFFEIKGIGTERTQLAIDIVKQFI